jgi:hypothetical protein
LDRLVGLRAAPLPAAVAAVVAAVAVVAAAAAPVPLSRPDC